MPQCINMQPFMKSFKLLTIPISAFAASSRSCAILMSSSSFVACNSRLRSAIRRHHPPQRAVLSQICCFGERKMLMFQILLNGAEPCDAGTTQLSYPVCRRGGRKKCIWRGTEVGTDIRRNGQGRNISGGSMGGDGGDRPPQRPRG